jgi:hypothetical protein
MGLHLEKLVNINSKNNKQQTTNQKRQTKTKNQKPKTKQNAISNAQA